MTDHSHDVSQANLFLVMIAATLTVVAIAQAIRPADGPTSASTSRYFPDRPRSGLYELSRPPSLTQPPVSHPSFDTIAGIRMVAFAAVSVREEPLTADQARQKSDHTRLMRIAPFRLSQTEITQGQFRAIMGYDNSSHRDALKPVNNVAFHEAVYFCWLLGQLDGRRYRLPTEKEWEFACRIGAEGLPAQEPPACSGPQRVTELPSDSSGLRGMLGNVAEWCDDAYSPSGLNDPTMVMRYQLFSDDRCVRGGSWCSPAGDLQPAVRTHRGPFAADDTVGFRIATDD